MMAGPAELQYLDITDFSPGIFEDITSKASTARISPAPDGAATPKGTYGCVAHPAGGLTGGPTITTFNVDVTPGSTNFAELGTIYWPYAPSPGPTSYRLIDFETYGPAYENFQRSVDQSAAANTIDDQLYDKTLFMPILQGWGRSTDRYSNRTADYDYSMTWYRILGIGDDNTAIQDDLAKRASAYYYPSAISVHASQKKFGFAEAHVASRFLLTGLAEWKFGTLGLVFTYAHVRDKLGYSFNSPNAGAYNWGAGADVVTPSNGTAADLSITYAGSAFGGYGSASIMTPFGAAIHGGRLIFIVGPASGYGSYRNGLDNDGGMSLLDGARAHAVPNNSQLHYSQPGDLTSPYETGVTTGKRLLGLSNQGATVLSTLTSINANQLFITTMNDGAITINGDLANPSVINLPGVESTYGATPHPVAINGGVVYGSKSGLFQWTGGESSECISTQLDGNFWRTPDMTPATYYAGAPMGRLGYRAPYLFAPNDWFRDMRSGGWWKLKDTLAANTKPYCVYRTAHDGKIWAAPSEHTSSTSWPISKVDIDTRNTAWEWRGQPITVSRNRRIQVRELDVVVSGAGYAVVRLEVEGTVVQSCPITNSSEYPQTYSYNADVVGTNIQISVAVLGACTIHRLSVGWREDTLLRTQALAG